MTDTPHALALPQDRRAQRPLLRRLTGTFPPRGPGMTDTSDRRFAPIQLGRYQRRTNRVRDQQSRQRRLIAEITPPISPWLLSRPVGDFYRLPPSLPTVIATRTSIPSCPGTPPRSPGATPPLKTLDRHVSATWVWDDGYSPVVAALCRPGHPGHFAHRPAMSSTDRVLARGTIFASKA